MKQAKTVWAVMTAGILMAGASVQAIPITGDITFQALVGPSVVTDTGDLSTATAINSFGLMFTAGGTGSYSGISSPIAVTFKGFSFNPSLSPSPVKPLWSFSSGNSTYDFVMSTLTSVDQGVDASGHNFLNITGAGMLQISDSPYDDTTGTWTLQSNGQGTFVTFNSITSANAAVPDGGTTVMLLGAGLAGLGLARRYLRI